MSIEYWYREPGDDDIPDPIQLDDDRVRLYTLDCTQNAEEGTIGISTFTIDDPNGDFEIAGHRIFAVKETAISASSNSFVYVGYTAERKYSRMKSDRVVAGRRIEVQTVDINTVLERRVMTGSDANRPAESDVSRVQWLVGTNEGHLVNTSRYLSTANPVSMDATDYRGQMFKSVLDDCAQQSGKDYWLTYFGDNATVKYPWGTFELFYDFRTSSAYASTIRLSNVLSDVDSTTTFAISAEDTSLRRDPSRVYSGVYMNYDGGAVYEQDNSTALAFARRDAISPAENVKTNAKATARAQRYLADIDTEEDVITTSFQVPAAYVNHLREGMLVDIKAIHLPGYDDFVTMRVLNRNVKQDSELTYRITIEAGLGQQSQPGSGHSVLWIQSIPFGTHSAVTSIEGSDDGVTWTPVIPDLSTGSVAGTSGDLWQITNPAHQGFRYWSFFYNHNHPGGFLAASSQRVLRLLDAAGTDYLGTLGDLNGAAGPPIPWDYHVPHTMVGPSVPYVATATGTSMARLIGTYHSVDFSGTAGPVNGDWTWQAPNTQPKFGTSSGVPPAGQKTARWVWDLGE